MSCYSRHVCKLESSFLSENAARLKRRKTFTFGSLPVNPVVTRALRHVRLLKISNPNKRDLYTCGVWVKSGNPVADLCPTNQLLYQTVQSGTALKLRHEEITVMTDTCPKIYFGKYLPLLLMQLSTCIIIVEDVSPLKKLSV